MKYLIVECTELNDQWECDADRRPICLTNDYSNYGRGYEVYEVKDNGTLNLIKDYSITNAEGIAVVEYSLDIDDMEGTVLKKYPNKTRDDISWAMVLLDSYGFEDIDGAIWDYKLSGECGEEINGKWLVIGEYEDDKLPLGY